jgi:PAS domain S-box-containing protein
MMEDEDRLNKRIKELEEQVANLGVINTVLMERVESAIDNSGNAFSLFERNILLEQYISQRTSDLKEANLRLKQEISDRKRAEEELAVERRMFVSGPVLVFKWRAADGWPVEYVSPNVTSLLGYSTDDLASGRVPYACIIHPDDIARVAEEVARHSVSGLLCFEQEYRLRRVDGDYRWIYDFTIPIRDLAGTITHYQGYILDITERKQVEEERKKLETQLRRAQRLETIGTLAGGVAHDFNNILTPILGYSDMALIYLEHDSPTRADIEQIVNAALRAKALVNQILMFSRQEEHEFSPARLHSVFKEALKLLKASIP